MSSQLSIRDLHKSFGAVKATNGASLELAQGRVARHHRPQRRR